MTKRIILDQFRDAISKQPASLSLGGPSGEEEKISPLVLDLEKNKTIIKNDNRTINLKNKTPGFLAEKIITEFKKRGRPKKQIFEFSSEAQLKKPIELYFSRRDNLEPLEISHPSRAEILATFEEIETLNNYLREYPLKTVTIESLKEADILDGLVNVWQADDFFIDSQKTEKETEEISEEEDFLATLVAQPDLTDQFLISPIQDGLFLDLKGEKMESLEQFYKPKLSLSRLSLKEKINNLKLFFGQWKNLKQGITFLSAGCFIFLIIFGMSLAGQGLLAKDNILGSALQAYQAMLAAKDSASNLNFSSAQVNFDTAYQNFLAADQELNKMGRGIISLLEALPGGSQVTSGSSLVKAGGKLAQAGQSFSKIANLFLLEKLSDYFSNGQLSLTQKIVEAEKEIKSAQKYLTEANQSLAQVQSSDLPVELAPRIEELKKSLPAIVHATGQLENWSDVFLGVLGHEKAQKYLLVFQNNSEARATGGFIGTYGVVDFDEGRLENLFIDGIFDLDGQLYEKIIPPRPIQKISTAWSTHDANWFADWPTSAKKIMGFYESAGGETVNGVISLTPTVIEKLLILTGPISLPQYSVTLDQNNFLEAVQYKVEIDYDKELNQPKKILADFAPLFLEKLWQVWPGKYQEIFKVFVDSLAEKQILFYFSDTTLETAFKEQGWTGEILNTEKDYLSVVNTNINGFKTDKVIEQKIYHQAQIQEDGSIIDTVKISRTHQGGQAEFDWYNKVNADYLRVYVPLGSKLLSAQGQTLESYAPPIDYTAQNFKSDADVLAQEQRTTVDQSGTQIFTESGKTVFGNWVYVSPGESVEVTYQYLLPFKINLKQESDSYSLLAQKQAGSKSSYFESLLILPFGAQINWQYPKDLQTSNQEIKFISDLARDRFYGLVFKQ